MVVSGFSVAALAGISEPNLFLDSHHKVCYLPTVPRPRRACITGIAGFAGSYLAETLVAAGYDVYGTRLRGETLEHLAGIRKHVTVRVLDIRSSRACATLLETWRPDALFHLAAQSDVGLSFADPVMTMTVNYGGTLNLLEVIREDAAVRRRLQSCIVVGSSDMYGKVTTRDLPLKESQPLNPVSPYAISKAAVDFLAATYHHAYGLPIIRVRAFNHAGPRQRQGFVIPDFAAQIVKLERRSKNRILKTGNLAVKRDITDVRDVARAYQTIAEQGTAGEVYHIGSGQAVAIKAILAQLLKMAARPIQTTVDPKRMRPAEVPVLQADISKLHTLGWQPEIPLGQTLHDTLEYYRTLT